MSKEMLINDAQSQECRIAVLDNGSLEELYVEQQSHVSLVGSMYKGKIVNIEQGIQAAFVDFGNGKNGFLHISDLHPKYFSKKKKSESSEKIGKRKALKDRPLIQDCLKKGMDLIVQVTKDGIKSKGPTLTTYVSLPGKYVVMMPWMERLGVSHKLEDDQTRDRLREILDEVKRPKNVGFIIRTAAAAASKRDIKNDIAYLSRLWVAIEKRIEKARSPESLYQESDLVIRTLRDVFDSKVSKVICDSKEVADKVRDFLAMAMPRYKKRAVYYDNPIPLFDKYQIEKELAKISSHTVGLKSGGSIVIEPTEALVAIDVNSGKYRKQTNAEKTAVKINVEAAKEIMRQLRLRDLGGLIICDFIDMREEANRKEVERVFRAEAKKDRARSKILRISTFGIIEMTRQRMGPSLELSTTVDCPYCQGRGIIKSGSAVSVEVIRKINLSVSKPQVETVRVVTSVMLANFLLNENRSIIAEIENKSGKKVVVNSSSEIMGDSYTITCYDERESVVKV